MRAALQAYWSTRHGAWRWTRESLLVALRAAELEYAEGVLVQ